MVRETVLALRTHALQLANCPAPVSEPVLQSVLLAGKLNQLDTAHPVFGKRDAIRVGGVAGVHHQGSAARGCAQLSDRPRENEERR